MTRTILFSDVDGTLLDRAGRYAMTAEELAPYQPRLSIVLASSRTVLELSRNQRDLGLTGPLVAENGAVLALPWHDRLTSIGLHEDIDGRPWCTIMVGAAAAEIREGVRGAAAALGCTYIEQAEVEPTLGRCGSVLLRPAAGRDDDSLIPLAARLRARGFSVASGGTWLAVTRGADKGRGARALLALLSLGDVPPRLVAAVGDGDNDVPLLLIADRRFVIASDDGTWHPALRALPGVTCMHTPGITGWRDVVAQLAAEEET